MFMCKIEPNARNERWNDGRKESAKVGRFSVFTRGTRKMCAVLPFSRLEPLSRGFVRGPHLRVNGIFLPTIPYTVRSFRDKGWNNLLERKKSIYLPKKSTALLVGLNNGQFFKFKRWLLDSTQFHGNKSREKVFRKMFYDCFSVFSKNDVTEKERERGNKQVFRTSNL